MNKLVFRILDRLKLRASNKATCVAFLSLTTCIITLNTTGCQPNVGFSFKPVGFSYMPPGELEPNSGQGCVDNHVYLRGMRFPLEQSPAYANSQVYRLGGEPYGGDQCDKRNYSYPWWDNFCEKRTWDVPRCPSGKGHQGQDIRPRDCTDSRHWAVAVEDGTIISIGHYSVSLQGESSIRHRYLHLNHEQLAVHEKQQVKRGDRIGLVSNNAGTSSTTIHLHFDMFSNGVYIPPYMSLVEAYKDLLKH